MPGSLYTLSCDPRLPPALRSVSPLRRALFFRPRSRPRRSLFHGHSFRLYSPPARWFQPSCTSRPCWVLRHPLFRTFLRVFVAARLLVVAAGPGAEFLEVGGAASCALQRRPRRRPAGTCFRRRVRGSRLPARRRRCRRSGECGDRARAVLVGVVPARCRLHRRRPGATPVFGLIRRLYHPSDLERPVPVLVCSCCLLVRPVGAGRGGARTEPSWCCPGSLITAPAMCRADHQSGGCNRASFPLSRVDVRQRDLPSLCTLVRRSCRRPLRASSSALWSIVPSPLLRSRSGASRCCCSARSALLLVVRVAASALVEFAHPWGLAGRSVFCPSGGLGSGSRSVLRRALSAILEPRQSASFCPLPRAGLVTHFRPRFAALGWVRRRSCSCSSWAA